ncbi:chitin synthase D [Uncinocarpus reesii 1704]|uniref:chitin synthase n=1 Tax=Uncinocarpus reesii (strain UAMH 1704) TaxID=336963 RepID=C4JLB2_UNCRE|nr:chitin synthase D [Uncinocarpus reesii 1704]EEP78774.1 chitin synthase D [Uncinocarpus reesii 1704]
MGLLSKAAAYHPSTEFRTQDKIYIGVIGPVMCAAVLEWFLWIAAFIYCLYKVYVKADHWSVKLMAVVMAVAFTALRGIFLPVMLVTLPLPYTITRHFPPRLVSFLQWFAFWTFAVLLIIPWLFCVYRLVTNSLGRKKRIKEVLDVRTAPKTVIVMPVYKEEPPVLIKAINSVVECDYPVECIHVFLSFDGDQVDELYLKVVEHLGVPINLKTYPQSIDVTYKGSRITISRFKHGGKRHCQKQTFRLVDKVYENYLRRNDNLFVLFIDSDCILDRYCLQNFMYDMELKPGSKRNMLAMTGVITSTTEKTSLITLLQDMEYIHGQLFERSVESGCGAVTCLPGALTILRFSAFRKMAKYYFADKASQCTDIFDFGKCHLGEDRWLTHLFMIGARERYQIQMCTSAFCKTEAVQTFSSLLKQRRRWFLGFITNEVCMLTDARLWFRYPILCLIRFMQNTIRTTALLFFIMIISIMTTSNRVENLPVGFIAVSLGLNYMLMFYFGLRLRRFKAWLYPMMFLLNPFFNWLYMVYGIFTAGRRTWGGPRADAAEADSNTTPAQAAELAEEQGDELNVKVETFTAVPKPQESVPVHPSHGIEGRFAPPELNSDGYYNNGNISGLSLPTHVRHNPILPHIPLHPRDSFLSEFTNGSGNSICWPRRVESIIADEEVDQEEVYITTEDQQKMQLARQARSSNAAVDGVPFDSVSDQEKDSISRALGPYTPDRRSNVHERQSQSGAYDRLSFDRARRPRVGQSPLRTSSAAEPEDEESGIGRAITTPDVARTRDSSAPEGESGRRERRRLSKTPREPQDMV